jgi:hypothetical protein
LEFTSKKVNENEEGLKLNDTHHVPVYIGDTSLIENINTTDLKADTKIISEATAKIRSYVYVHMPSAEVRENRNIERATSFEQVVNLKKYRKGSNKRILNSRKPRAQYNM